MQCCKPTEVVSAAPASSWMSMVTAKPAILPATPVQAPVLTTASPAGTMLLSSADRQAPAPATRTTTSPPPAVANSATSAACPATVLEAPTV